MFKIVNPDLPAFSMPEAKAGSWKYYNSASRRLLPLIKINSLANINEDIIETSFPVPYLVGSLFKVKLGFLFNSIAEILGLTPTGLPHLVDNSFWYDSEVVTIYSSNLTEGDTLSISVGAIVQIPSSTVEGVYEVDISDWGNFVAASASISSYNFTLGDNLSQDGAVITLATDRLLDIGDFVVIHGIQSLVLERAGLKGCSVDLSGTDLVLIDSVEKLGYRYSSAEDLYSIKTCEYVWDYNHKEIHLFLKHEY